MSTVVGNYNFSCFYHSNNNTLSLNTANKESSGNANLKLVPEKKLCKVVENITSRNFSLSAKVIELISAYSQHCMFSLVSIILLIIFLCQIYSQLANSEFLEHSVQQVPHCGALQ